MNFDKLKLSKFTTYNGFQLPLDFAPPLLKNENPEVFFLFVSSIEETMRAINMVQNNQKHQNNRLFFVYKKGNKSFHRDHIYHVVMKNKRMKRKAPVLSSLDETYSVFSFSIDV